MLFRERQQVTISVAAIAVMGCFVLLRYLPLNRQIRAVRETKAAHMLLIARGRQHAGQLPGLKERLAGLQAVVGNYESSIPEERALGPFLGRIADLMNEYALTEQAVTPGEEVTAGELTCIPVDLRCRGKLAQVFEFYKRLHGLDRLIRIEHVKLVNDGDYKGQVCMETRAVIYYRPRVGQG